MQRLHRVYLYMQCISRNRATHQCSVGSHTCTNVRVSRRLLHVACVWLALTCVCTLQGHTKHSVGLEDLQTVKNADALKLSPDGETLAYVVDDNLWLLATKVGAEPRKIGKATAPVWSPDSLRIAYYSMESGSFQLWVLDTRTGSTTQITNLEGGINPDAWTRMLGWTWDALRASWSRDGLKIAFASQVEIKNEVPSLSRSSPTATGEQSAKPLVLTNTTPLDWTLAGIFPKGFATARFVNGKFTAKSDNVTTNSIPLRLVNQLFVVDVSARKVEQLTKDVSVYFNPEWSADDSQVICVSSEGRSLRGMGEGTTNLYAIDIHSGAKTRLTSGPGDKRLPQLSPNGQWIVYLGGEHFSRQSIFVIPAKGGRSTRVGSNLHRSVVDVYWSGDSKGVFCLYVDGVAWSIVHIDCRTGRIERLSGSDAHFRWQLTASQVGAVAWEDNSGSASGIIRMLHPHCLSSVVLVNLNPQIDEWQLGSQEVVRWHNNRGEARQGLLVKPVGYVPGRRYAAIVDCYPGMPNSLRSWAMMGNQAWASRGYIVFYPDPRAPHTWMNPFLTKQYDEAARGSRGWEITVDDVMTGVDELIRRGIVDPNRMGLYGFSNGGGVVNYLVTRTSRFRCAVSVSGAFADWVRPYLLGTLPTVPVFAGGVTLWKNPMEYIRLSAVFHLDKVRTPMLLAAGDDDGDFLLNTIEMYNGLRWLKRNVEFVRYPGQGHGFTGAAMKDFWERENSFFDEHLLQEATPKHVRTGIR
jgi:dipeptidyl aminopeptidase/acylaminoacyl peptidase